MRAGSAVAQLGGPHEVAVSRELRQRRSAGWAGAGWPAFRLNVGVGRRLQFLPCAPLQGLLTAWLAWGHVILRELALESHQDRSWDLLSANLRQDILSLLLNSGSHAANPADGARL